MTSRCRWIAIQARRFVRFGEGRTCWAKMDYSTAMQAVSTDRERRKCLGLRMIRNTPNAGKATNGSCSLRIVFWKPSTTRHPEFGVQSPLMNPEGSEVAGKNGGSEVPCKVFS